MKSSIKWHAERESSNELCYGNLSQSEVISEKISSQKRHNLRLALVLNYTNFSFAFRPHLTTTAIAAKHIKPSTTILATTSNLFFT